MTSRPAATTTPDAPVDEAIGTMLERHADGLVVVPPDGDLVAGLVVKSDVLRALARTDEDRPDVSVTDGSLLAETTREEVAERVESVAAKDSDLQVHGADVRFQKHDEERRGRRLVRCQVRLHAGADTLIAAEEEYGGDAALTSALETLERSVVERKERRADREANGRFRGSWTHDE